MAASASNEFSFLLAAAETLEQVFGVICGVEWMGNGMERFRVDGGTARDDFGQNFGTLVMERCGRNQGLISGVNGYV